MYAPTVYTIRAINEFGHPIYQQTTRVGEAWRIFKAWQISQVTDTGLRDVRVEPAIPVVEDDESLPPGQMYVTHDQGSAFGRAFTVRTHGWAVAATIRERGDHNYTINVYDAYREALRSLGSYHVSLRSALVIAETILRELARVDGVDPRPGIVYTEDALSEAF